jgi:hypothetical protein
VLRTDTGNIKSVGWWWFARRTDAFEGDMAFGVGELRWLTGEVHSIHVSDSEGRAFSLGEAPHALGFRRVGNFSP